MVFFIPIFSTREVKFTEISKTYQDILLEEPPGQIFAQNLAEVAYRKKMSTSFSKLRFISIYHSLYSFPPVDAKKHKQLLYC